MCGKIYPQLTEIHDGYIKEIPNGFKAFNVDNSEKHYIIYDDFLGKGYGIFSYYDVTPYEINKPILLFNADKNARFYLNMHSVNIFAKTKEDVALIKLVMDFIC